MAVEDALGFVVNGAELDLEAVGIGKVDAVGAGRPPGFEPLLLQFRHDRIWLEALDCDAVVFFPIPRKQLPSDSCRIGRPRSFW
jgi:hypothetical protein